MTKLVSEDSNRFRKTHRNVLVVCVLVLVVSLVLTVDGEGRLCVLGLPQKTLPGLCIWHRLFGINCPGCGLTRSVVMTVHGDLGGAFATHRIGPIVVLVLLLQLPYRLGAFFRKTDYPFRHMLDWITVGVLLVLLAGNWLTR